jgi:hypothetical protein
MPDFKTIADFRKDKGSAIQATCRQFVLLNPLPIDRPRPPENTAPCGTPPVARFATAVGLRPPFVTHPATPPHPDRRALLILFAAQQAETGQYRDEPPRPRPQSEVNDFHSRRSPAAGSDQGLSSDRQVLTMHPGKQPGWVQVRCNTASVAKIEWL